MAFPFKEFIAFRWQTARRVIVIARLADQGNDVSRRFTNTGHMMMPGSDTQGVNVDLASGMLAELDRGAKELT